MLLRLITIAPLLAEEFFASTSVLLSIAELDKAASVLLSIVPPSKGQRAAIQEASAHRDTILRTECEAPTLVCY